MSEEYRHHFFVKRTGQFNPAKELKPLRDLKPEEQARVARNKASVYEHLPEAVPFIKELHEAGMIDGWRGVGAVTPLPNPLPQREREQMRRTDFIEGKEHGTA